MKKAICLFLCCICLLLCFGCSEEAPDASEVPEGPLFYYPTAQLAYQPGSKAIDAEARVMPAQADLAQMLNIYFLGPETAQLLSPFPSGLRIVKTTVVDKTVYITVSDHLTELTGLALTMACSCLTLTTLELTGAENVVINAQDALLDGQKSITMDKNNLLLTDVWQEE